MKIKMYTTDDRITIDSNEVTQFYPDFESGGKLTAIETISPNGERSLVRVKHSFYQVTRAMATAWGADEKKGNAGEGSNDQNS